MAAVATNLSGIGSLKSLKAKAQRIRATWRRNVRGVFRGNGPRITWKPAWLGGVGGLRDASRSRGSGISSTIKQFSDEFALQGSETNLQQRDSNGNDDMFIRPRRRVFRLVSMSDRRRIDMQQEGVSDL
jgi:hypothetical protein